MPLKILGSRVDSVTCQDALEQTRRFLLSSQVHHIITGNTLMCLEAEHDFELRQILEKAALVVPESSGILWASKVLGAPLKEFVPGIDLMMALCQMMTSMSSSPADSGGGSIKKKSDGSPIGAFGDDGKGIFLLGSKSGVAEEAAIVLKQKFPSLVISGTHHGYFTDQDEAGIIARVRAAAPSLLFVGMGMPAQEKWIATNLDALGVPVVMGVGGSFDVLSGRLARAPAWMRRLGIEWLYRLGQEPWRWRRIAQLPVFAWHVLKETQNAKRRTQNIKRKND